MSYEREYEEGQYQYEPPPLPTVHPGANQGSGPWAPGYDPGANWNDGQKPTDDSLWNVGTSQWDTPADPAIYRKPTADPTPKAAPRPPVQQPPTNNGAVPPMGGGLSGGGGSGINVPSSTLPQNILDLFNQKPTQTPIQGAYQDALLKYMGRSQETPTLNDSILGPQSEVFRAANQRNTERQRLTAVERAGTGQSGSGYLDNLINEGVQKQGFNNAQFDANLLGGEMNKRREELQAALQLASATGNQEATRELQARLAQVQAAMQQQGLNLQGQLGMGDLDLRWALGSEQLNQNALRLIMGGT